MRALAAFPLMILAVIAYNAVAFGGAMSLNADIYVADMSSGAVFAMTMSDVLVAVGLFFLFLEVIKAARSSNATILDHMLSTAVFIVALVEFLLVEQAGTVAFALIMAMCLIDVVAGYTISISTARRDINFGGDG